MPGLNLIIVKKPVSLHLTKMRSKTCYNNSSQTIPSNSYEQTQFKTNQKNINVIHKQITDMQDQKMQHQMSGTENAGPEFVRPNVTHARTHARMHAHTHTHTQLFNSHLFGTTRVCRYQKKHSPTRTHKEEEGLAQTTRSTAWKLILFTVL